MNLDFGRFYNACNPSRSIDFANKIERQYYIDFSLVRGKQLMQSLTTKIVRADQPTIQLFTGHIGCGKSTELTYLKESLEQEQFAVIYIKLDSVDNNLPPIDEITVSDLLLLIARKVAESQKENGFDFISKFFETLFDKFKDSFPQKISVSELSLNLGILTAKAKTETNTHNELRRYLELTGDDFVEAINQDILTPTIKKLQKNNKKGLVIIVDDLDRRRSNTKDLFGKGAGKLKGLNCHKIYTIPLHLNYSREEGKLIEEYLGNGQNPITLPMIPVRLLDGNPNQEGVNLLKDLVIARAFPEMSRQKRDQSREELLLSIFESSDVWERLCEVSGGHVRNFLNLLYESLSQQTTLQRLSKECLEYTISCFSENLECKMNEDDWQMLFKVITTQKQTEDGKSLFLNLFLFEYPYGNGKRWFGINPLLRETETYKRWEGQQV